MDVPAFVSIMWHFLLCPLCSTTWTNPRDVMLFLAWLSCFCFLVLFWIPCLLLLLMPSAPLSYLSTLDSVLVRGYKRSTYLCSISISLLSSKTLIYSASAPLSLCRLPILLFHCPIFLLVLHLTTGLHVLCRHTKNNLPRDREGYDGFEYGWKALDEAHPMVQGKE